MRLRNSFCEELECPSFSIDGQLEPRKTRKLKKSVTQMGAKLSTTTSTTTASTTTTTRPRINKLTLQQLKENLMKGPIIKFAHGFVKQGIFMD